MTLRRRIGSFAVKAVAAAKKRRSRRKPPAKVAPTTAKPVARVSSPPRADTRPVATSTYEATPFVKGRHRTDVTHASQAEREAFTADPQSTWDTSGGTDIIHEAMGFDTKPTVGVTGLYEPPGAKVESNPARGAPTHPLMLGYDIDPRDAVALTAGEAVRAVGDVQGGSAWSLPLRVPDLRRSGSLFMPTDRATDIQRMLALKQLGQRYGLTDVIDLGQGLGMTAFYPHKQPSGRDTLSALRRAGLQEDIENISGSSPQMVDWRSGYAAFEDPWQSPDFSGDVTRELQSYLDPLQQADPERYHALLDDPAIAETFGRRYMRDEAARALGAPVRQDVQEARDRIANAGRLRALLDAYRQGIPTMAQGGHVHGG
jgi:hypothetical protein